MKKETTEWLNIAHEDYQAAESLLEGSLFRMSCYHSQQTIEKILKAILIENDIKFGRVHNIIDLSQLLVNIGLTIPITAEEGIFLQSIYRARYPSDIGLLPGGAPIKEDAECALRIATRLVQHQQTILKP